MRKKKFNPSKDDISSYDNVAYAFAESLFPDMAQNMMFVMDQKWAKQGEW